ncbi:hypothetical protein ACET3Z_008560 [Daucus carota]
MSIFSYDYWSIWWQSNDHNDNIALIMFSLSLVLFTISWYSWMLNKPKNLLLPPGPRGLPVVGSLPFLKPEFHSYLESLARIYGPILTLRLGQKISIVITSPALAREVLKDNDVNFANRDVPAVTKAMETGACDIVWTPYGPEWRMLRKVCVREMLGHSILDTVYHIRQQEIKNTCKYLYDQANCPVNLGEQMFLTVLNVITNMLWGGSVKGKERAAIAMEFRQAVAEVSSSLAKPNISDFFPVLARFDLQGVKKKAEGANKKLDLIFDAVIDQRLKMEGGGTESKDFLQVLLQLKDDKDAKVPLTMNHLKALLLDMVVGGTDTASNTIEFAMAELMNSPEIMKKAQEEIDLIVGNDSTVEESHLPKLPYLNDIMKEVLRLHPALPLLVPHSPNESCIIGGYTVPKGSRVFINAWAIQRDPSIWENPLEFRPERFADGKLDYSGHDFNYFPFGSGRRICAGLPMAERTVMYFLASLLHSFNWDLPAGEKLDVSEKFGIVLKKRVPLVVVPTPRLSVSSY